MRFTRKPQRQRYAFVANEKKNRIETKRQQKLAGSTAWNVCVCICFKCKNCVNGKSAELKHLWLVVLTAADTNRTVCRSANKFCARQWERIWFVFAVVSYSIWCLSRHAYPLPFFWSHFTIIASSWTPRILCHNCTICSSHTTEIDSSLSFHFGSVCQKSWLLTFKSTELVWRHSQVIFFLILPSLNFSIWHNRRHDFVLFFWLKFRWLFVSEIFVFVRIMLLLKWITIRLTQ